ncbi:hypothetical protein D3C75_1328520 [compost metagenome]
MIGRQILPQLPDTATGKQPKQPLWTDYPLAVPVRSVDEIVIAYKRHFTLAGHLKKRKM